MPDAIPLDVAKLFEKLAHQVKARGYSRFSSDAILHQIRWQYQIDRGIRDFKCNDNWTATLARWCMENNPYLEGLFELRKINGRYPIEGDPYGDPDHIDFFEE